jgi:hypothetical protein
MAPTGVISRLKSYYNGDPGEEIVYLTCEIVHQSLDLCAFPLPNANGSHAEPELPPISTGFAVALLVCSKYPAQSTPSSC